MNLFVCFPVYRPGDQHSNRADHKVSSGVNDWESGFIGKGGKHPEQCCHNNRSGPKEFDILASQYGDRDGDRRMYHKEQ